MSIKRIAIAGIIAATLTLAACSNGGTTDPTTTPSETPTPTPTATNPKVSAPANEDEAITAAETVLTQYFVTRGEVNAAGGTDTAPLEDWATGRALDVAVNDATGIANGPILNVDQAKQVYVIKRGQGKGYSGVENELFFKDNTNMVYGDAQKVMVQMIQALKELGE